MKKIWLQRNFLRTKDVKKLPFVQFSPTLALLKRPNEYSYIEIDETKVIEKYKKSLQNISFYNLTIQYEFYLFGSVSRL